MFPIYYLNLDACLVHGEHPTEQCNLDTARKDGEGVARLTLPELVDHLSKSDQGYLWCQLCFGIAARKTMIIKGQLVSQ
jgi:hypothetical protein